VANYEWLLQSKSFLSKDTLAYVMPWERSIDIDTEKDLQYLNYEYFPKNSKT
jgi:N-acylneuraminate cytidylyltransferase